MIASLDGCIQGDCPISSRSTSKLYPYNPTSREIRASLSESIRYYSIIFERRFSLKAMSREYAKNKEIYLRGYRKGIEKSGKIGSVDDYMGMQKQAVEEIIWDQVREDGLYTDEEILRNRVLNSLATLCWLFTGFKAGVLRDLDFGEENVTGSNMGNDYY